MPIDCQICCRTIQSLKDMCRTDCNHMFCQSCICKKLSRDKNLCPACDSVVRVVTTQADELNIQPTKIKFCNVIYILHVSIWFVEDPSSLLADLFDLYGMQWLGGIDIWVLSFLTERKHDSFIKASYWKKMMSGLEQLFSSSGRRRKLRLQARAAPLVYCWLIMRSKIELCNWMAILCKRADFSRLLQLLYLPFVLFYHFICSFSKNSYYQPVQQNRDDASKSQSPSTKQHSPSKSQFREPGRVRIPSSGETV